MPWKMDKEELEKNKKIAHEIIDKAEFINVTARKGMIDNTSSILIEAITDKIKFIKGEI